MEAKNGKACAKQFEVSQRLSLVSVSQPSHEVPALGTAHTTGQTTRRDTTRLCGISDHAMDGRACCGTTQKLYYPPVSDCKTSLVRCEGVARGARSTLALRHLPLGCPPQCSVRGSDMVELRGIKRYISGGDVTRLRHVTATSSLESQNLFRMILFTLMQNA